MSKENKLKPCPFCGGKANIVQKVAGFKQNPLTISNQYAVSCSSGCCATKNYTDEIIRTVESVEIKHDGVKDAIRAWNNRTEHTCENCKGYDDFNGTCHSGDSPNRADFVSEDEWCEAYEEG